MNMRWHPTLISFLFGLTAEPLTRGYYEIPAFLTFLIGINVLTFGINVLLIEGDDDNE